jgi:hypothetical protein
VLIVRLGWIVSGSKFGGRAARPFVFKPCLPVRPPPMKIMSAMANRYFLDKQGAKTFRVGNASGKRHIDIGAAFLSKKGITPTSDADVYTQMFKLRFARVVEHDGGTVEVEHTRPLTNHQERFLKALSDAGKHIAYISANR